MHVVKIVLENIESRFDRIWHWFDWLANRGNGRDFWSGEGVSVDEGMSGGSSLDFSQAYEIAALEVAISVLEFP